MSDPHDALTNFDGTARLFPLPNLVLFPHVMQPLHIFEPRYRQMTADALADDRRIALVLPRPGWEQDYAGKPALHPVACLGRIESEQRLADGRYNLLLRGAARVRILEEVSRSKLYRVARVEPLDEEPCASADAEARWRRRLIQQAPDWLPCQGDVAKQLDQLLHGDLPLGALCDVLAFMLPLDAEFKQTLLEELHVARRLERLLHHLDTSRRPFPPEFSDN